jgi:hypothetical protein
VTVITVSCVYIGETFSSGFVDSDLAWRKLPMYSIFGLTSPQVTVLGSGMILIVAAVSAYIFRAQRASRASVVVCPPASMPGLVEADGYLRVTSCSRLPDGHTCDQKCVPQLAYSPDTLDVFLEKHKGQKCSGCSAEIDSTDWYKSRLSAGSAAIDSVHARATHDTGDRICWDCFVTASRTDQA